MRASQVSLSLGDYFANGRLMPAFEVLTRTVNALLARTGGVAFKALGPVPSYTVATAPDPSAYPRCFIFVSDEAGGATMAFSDGADWLRISDLAPIS